MKGYVVKRTDGSPHYFMNFNEWNRRSGQLLCSVIILTAADIVNGPAHYIEWNWRIANYMNWLLYDFIMGVVCMTHDDHSYLVDFETALAWRSRVHRTPFPSTFWICLWHYVAETDDTVRIRCLRPTNHLDYITDFGSALSIYRDSPHRHKTSLARYWGFTSRVNA